MESNPGTIWIANIHGSLRRQCYYRAQTKGEVEPTPWEALGHAMKQWKNRTYPVFSNSVYMAVKILGITRIGKQKAELTVLPSTSPLINCYWVAPYELWSDDNTTITGLHHSSFYLCQPIEYSPPMQTMHFSLIWRQCESLGHMQHLVSWPRKWDHQLHLNIPLPQFDTGDLYDLRSGRYLNLKSCSICPGRRPEPGSQTDNFLKKVEGRKQSGNARLDCSSFTQNESCPKNLSL